MFETSKLILTKVSFDKKLFKKELSKAIKWLKPNEVIQLRLWCLTTFGHLYKDAILEAFNQAVQV